MGIIRDLKNKLRTFVAKKTEVNQDQFCPHCRVDEDSLRVLQGKGGEKSRAEENCCEK